MYEVDEKDVVLPLQGVPQSSIGAPEPFVIADENFVVSVTYLPLEGRTSSRMPERYNSLAAKELKTNEHPILAVRDRDSPHFDLLGTEQD